MSNEYKSRWWSIELPSPWKAEKEENCIAFSAEHGIGALQISAYRRDGEFVTNEDLNDFAEAALIDGVIPQQVSCGDFRGIAICYVENNRFWRKLWLRSGSLLLYVTYNCAEEDQGIEVGLVDSMINSLKSGLPDEA